MLLQAHNSNSASAAQHPREIAVPPLGRRRRIARAPPNMALSISAEVALTSGRTRGAHAGLLLLGSSTVGEHLPEGDGIVGDDAVDVQIEEPVHLGGAVDRPAVHRVPLRSARAMKSAFTSDAGGWMIGAGAT